MKRCGHFKIFASLMILFTLLSLLTIGSNAVSYDDNDIMHSDKAEDLLCILSGRKYYKAYDGEALVGYFYCSTGYSGPILVSEEADNVAFTTTWDGRILEYGGTVEYDGKTYYYSSTEYFMPGDLTNTDTNKLYKCSDGQQISAEAAALELLAMQMVCGGKYKEHQNVQEIVALEATCTAAGRCVKKCLSCNTELEESKIPPLGHVFGAPNVEKNASCTEEGIQYRDCLVCGFNQMERIPKTDHHFGDWEIVKQATCTLEGQQECRCSECEKQEKENIPVLGHVYGEYKIVSGSKLIPPIVKERACSLCGNSEQLNDWSYIWVTILAGVAAVGIIIGVISYIRAFKER